VRRTKFVILTIVLLLTGNASAQFLGQMSPATIMNESTGKAGGYFILAEDAAAVVGSARYGFNKYTEARFRMGFIDPDAKGADAGIILGIDAKYLLWEYVTSSGMNSTGYRQSYNNPFDMSLGGSVEYANMDYGGILGIGVSVIGSLPFRFENGSIIEPYARLQVRYEYLQLDRADDDTDIEIGLNMGAVFSVTPLVDFTAEFQLDDQMAFMLGIDIVAF